VKLSQSTVSGNSTAGDFAPGGGIFSRGGDVTLSQSTVSGNNARGRGGGISVFSGDLVVHHSTITDNTSGDAGGGIYATEAVALDHTIVAGNHDNSGTAHDIAGVVNATYSLIGFGANFLGPLADNGGPTMTHALLPGSPAINAGDPNFVGPPDYDQRGFPYKRVSGGRIDIGAFEAQPLPGDFDVDGDADHDDLVLWEAGYGAGGMSGLDFLAWQIMSVRAAPTPTTAAATAAPTQTDIDPRLVDLAVTLQQNRGAVISFSGLSSGHLTEDSRIDSQPIDQQPPAAPLATPSPAVDHSFDLFNDEPTVDDSDTLDVEVFDEIFALV
jgi:predicted outer membrane repeat protein